MNKPNFSFEFFPTKTDDGVTKLCQTFDTLNELSPAYFSVTYGAGGTTRQRTIGIVETLHNRANTPILPSHISCIGDDKSVIGELLEHYKSIGINRIVALRGDLPSGQVGMGELPFAVDLVRFIREHTGDHFHIELLRLILRCTLKRVALMLISKT